MRKLYTQLLSLLIVLCFCSGCSVIRGIFGGNDPGNKPSLPDELPPTIETHDGNGEGYGVVRYVRIKPKYTCKDKQGNIITSYKDSIDVDEAKGSYKQMGDKCTTSPLATGNTNELEISKDKLSFKGGIYQKELK